MGIDLDETERKALEWISSINAEEDHSAIVRRRSENTALWLLQHPTYADWVTAPSSFLWLYGNSTPSKYPKLTLQWESERLFSCKSLLRY